MKVFFRFLSEWLSVLFANGRIIFVLRFGTESVPTRAADACVCGHVASSTGTSRHYRECRRAVIRTAAAAGPVLPTSILSAPSDAGGGFALSSSYG